MRGMSRATGGPISGDAHIVQSVLDILATPIGSRVLRRGYGSNVPSLIDGPINNATLLAIGAAAAQAIAKWEPRVWVRQAPVEAAGADGHVRIGLDLVKRVDGQPLRVEALL